ncbi:ATP-binding protein [Wenzhouxiangella marina]|uniref:ATPase associated with various cellular activities AAA_5 n=1 Tax=Wenzhouxiangella marina TaxID=1579979 RepID=A0A0K0XWL7_9GAMM|nr:AAA family ATPase [Wenzhouxiangella marina]AKS42065.1 ATPase associated with various cellular activities AAA_5 [Wenzhouxiangella marina]MBB6086166.1 MoxR-like ATPase [Wenzhouxiangella marina]
MSRKKITLQRQPAEMMFSEELKRLKDWDSHPVPPGWNLSPIAVEAFVLGHPELNVEPKVVADPGVITRVIIGLLTDRGCLLIGEPGTAKSWISELVAAAISGDSSLTLQGGAVAEVGQLLYTWNRAILAERGPCMEALVPSPIYRGMRDGKMVRFEEVARCPQPLQDALLSILSDRVITIPELSGKDGVLYARAGFNVIATSNSVDEGVHHMSAALKRRMNFEMIHPIRQLADEIEVVDREVRRLNRMAELEVDMDESVIEVLVTIFHELRNGQTLDGRSTDRLAGATMSTAEAVGVGHAMSVHAYYYNEGRLGLDQLVHFIIGSALKDHPEDRRRLRHFFDTEIAKRKSHAWRAVWAQRELI